MGIRILIADRHEMFREVLRPLLAKEPDFTVVGDTGDGNQLLHLIEQLKPDVLLLDLNLRKRSGMEVLREIAAPEGPMCPILLTDKIEKSEILESLRWGARGVILKSEPTQLLFKCIRTVMTGEFWINRKGVGDLVRSLRGLSVRCEENALAGTRDLTARQQLIINAILSGCTNKEIAKELSIGERTVKYHLTHIFEKLGVSDRRQLAELTLKTNRMDSSS
jgi:two-component system nitrate/nitrite response regulator NarL